ncbi:MULTISPECIES: energy transducer TonB family protein [Methylobacterium]|jgi:protein TonB|uniref:Protein TonB n=2 Tax=Methylobacterium TaxID=407 RepID=A0AAE8HSL5_9HYPH|nr:MULTISPECIES: energy transducer TonB [Methylobacterium]AIQ91307.1 TolA protein [Methylobacterium oryzae CBMB20]APT31871.1 stress response protein NST1 [Methylobacterium phyllosphaerae]AWV16825.1 protein TolA [Methylobacterium sp. XJLW]MDE4912302.1 TonB family protein [Methylobacterium sp. 092160098-2]MDH3029100.1 TonB family protein [Methylobacterium fujisawaense]
MSTFTSTDLPVGAGERRPSGLVAAFLVALGLHALALAAMMFLRLAPPAPPGEQQITVDLAPLMTDATTEAPAEQQMSQEAPPETKPVDAPPDEAVQPPPPTEMTEVKPEDTQPVEAPAEAQPVEAQNQVITSTSEAAEPLAAPPTEVAKTEEPPKPTPDPAKLKAEREAKLRKIREEKLREQKREEARQERLEEIREAKAKAAREAKAREAKARAGAERSSASASRQNAVGRAAAGNDPSAMRQWQGAISAAIHSRMNVNAAVGTGGGTAVVRFTVMRSGQVTGAGLARSSGIGQIDSAALAAVRGSMPAAPPGVTLSNLTVSIPLRFGVR